MGADILNGQSFIHIILADIFFDQKNRGIFVRIICRVPEERLCLFRKSIMQAGKRKTPGNGFRNALRIF